MVRVVPFLQFIEALVNIVSGFIYMFAPHYLVQDMLRPELQGEFVGSHVEAVWKIFGTVVVSQSVALMAGAFGDGKIQKIAYLVLSVGEVLIVPLSYNYVETYGVWNMSSYGFVYSMATLLVARIVALLFFPSAFQDLKEKRK
jgi:hypothetical protein